MRKSVVLCTIVESQGSSPRKTGARMAVEKDGTVHGSIGGGELEKICIQKAVDFHKNRQSGTEFFDLDEKANGPVSMICGGKVKVNFQYTESFDISQLKNKDGKVYIFGGGHVGSELVPLLEHLWFSVTLLDDREEFADSRKHPMADSCILCDYSNISDYVEISKDDYVVIMTHGHIGDRDILLQVCKINPTYIGCIGSRKKVEMTRKFLRENGIPDSIIDSIHSPIGIELYGDTPEEIALSTAAEIVRHRSILNGLNAED